MLTIIHTDVHDLSYHISLKITNQAQGLIWPSRANIYIHIYIYIYITRNIYIYITRNIYIYIYIHKHILASTDWLNFFESNSLELDVRSETQVWSRKRFITAKERSERGGRDQVLHRLATEYQAVSCWPFRCHPHTGTFSHTKS